jgi:hypothetical protein
VETVEDAREQLQTELADESEAWFGSTKGQLNQARLETMEEIIGRLQRVAEDLRTP